MYRSFEEKSIKIAKTPIALILVLLHATAATPASHNKGRSSIYTEKCMEKYFQAMCNTDIPPALLQEFNQFNPKLPHFSREACSNKQNTNNAFKDFDESISQILEYRAVQPVVPETEEEQKHLLQIIESIPERYCSTNRQTPQGRNKFKTKGSLIHVCFERSVLQSVLASEAYGIYAECLGRDDVPSQASRVVSELRDALRARIITDGDIFYEYTAKLKSAAKVDFAAMMANRLECFLLAELDIDSKRRKRKLDFIRRRVKSSLKDYKDIVRKYTKLDTQITDYYTYLISWQQRQTDLVKNLFNDLLSKTSSAEILLTADDRLNALFYSSKLPANQTDVTEQFLLKTSAVNTAILEDLHADYVKCFESKERLGALLKLKNDLQKAESEFQSKIPLKATETEEEDIRLADFKRRILIAYQAGLADELAISAYCYVKVEKHMPLWK